MVFWCASTREVKDTVVRIYIASWNELFWPLQLHELIILLIPCVQWRGQEMTFQNLAWHFVNIELGGGLSKSWKIRFYIKYGRGLSWKFMEKAGSPASSYCLQRITRELAELLANICSSEWYIQLEIINRMPKNVFLNVWMCALQSKGFELADWPFLLNHAPRLRAAILPLLPDTS